MRLRGAGTRRGRGYGVGLTIGWRVLSVLLLLLGGLSFTNLRAGGVAPVAAAAGISVANTVKEDPLVGGPVTYTITVTNVSYADVGTNPGGRAYNVDIVDLLPAGVIFTSAKIAGSTTVLTPTTVVTNPGAPVEQQRIELTFKNLTDLVRAQAYSIEITGKLNDALTPNTQLTNSASARVANDAHKPGSDPTNAPDNVSTAFPFKLAKVTNQSTGVNQATGDCNTGRKFSYLLTATNNPLNQSTALVITDTLPRGVIYCSTLQGPNPTQAAGANGTTILTYGLGTIGAGLNRLVEISVAIPYAYLDDPNAVIGDGTTFINKAQMEGDFAMPVTSGNPNPPVAHYKTAEKQSLVTAKYLTIKKSSSVVVVDQNTVITYTVTVAPSVYYNSTGVKVTDTLPNGQEYLTSPLTPANGFPTPGPNGTTIIQWNLDPQGPYTSGADYSFTFTARVRQQYSTTGVPPVVSGDNFTNQIAVDYIATSVNATPANGPITASDNASIGQSTRLPEFSKTVTAVTHTNRITNPATRGQVISPTEATAVVGDEVTFVLYFKAQPEIDGRDILITDILPANYAYIAGSSSFTGSYITGGGRINGGAAGPECRDSNNANICTDPGALLLYRLTGGIADDNITPKAKDLTITLRAKVVSYELPLENLGRMGGSGTTGLSGGASGITYSERHSVKLTTLTPSLTIAKAAAAVASPLIGNGVVDYTLTVTNASSATAYGVGNITDQLPADLKYVGSSATPAAAFVSYAPSGSGYGGTLTLTAGATLTPGQTVTITYRAQVQPSPIVNTTEQNTATIADYYAQPNSTVKNANPAQASATVTIGGNVLEKRVTNVTKSNNPAVVTVGDVVTYELKYTLPKDTQVYNSQLRECLPLGFHYVATSYSGVLVGFPAGTRDQIAQADPTTGAAPVTISVVPGTGASIDGGPACSTAREEIVIPIGNQDSTGATADAILTISLQAKITGRNNAGTAVFPNTGPDLYYATDNNVVSLYTATGSGGSPTRLVATKSVANGDAARVYVPKLTLSKTIALPTGPVHYRPDGTTQPGTAVVKQGETVKFLLSVTNASTLVGGQQVGATAVEIGPLVDTLPTGLGYQGVYQSDSSCSIGAATVPAYGGTGPITITMPATLAANAPVYFCLVVQVTEANYSLPLTNTLRLDPLATNSQAYYTEPAPMTAPDTRVGYLPPAQQQATVYTWDLITFGALPNKVYGDGPVQLDPLQGPPPVAGAATSSGSLVLTYTVVSLKADGSPAPAGSVCVLQNGKAVITGAGTCQVTASQGGRNRAPDVTQSFVIAKAPLTVRVNDQTRVFGDPLTFPCDPAAGTVTGFKFNETTANLQGALVCTGSATPTSAPGSYLITPSGYSSQNYNIAYTRARLTITARPVAVAIADATVPKGGTATLTATIDQTKVNGIAPSGYIQFYFNGRLLSSVQVVNGQATYTFKPSLNPNIYPTEVRFLSADTRFAPGSPATGKLTITP